MRHPYAHCLARARSQWPDQVAVVDEARDQRLTWAELADRVARLAAGLAQEGVGAGDRVVVRQANTSSYVEAVIAVAWLGAAFVPVLDTAEDREREHVVEAVAPAAILDAREPLDGRMDRHQHPAPVQGSPALLSQILFTSGSAGQPKGVAHTFASSAAAMGAWTHLTRADPRQVVLVTTPISHAAGRLVESAMSVGGQVVILDTARADVVLPAIERHRVSHMILVPTVLQELVDSPALDAHDHSSLRCVLYASSPASPSLVLRAHERLGPVLHTVYGSTEAPAPNTHLTAEEHARAVERQPELLRSCGREYASGVQLRLVDQDLRDVAPGELGELLICSPWLACGYWRQQELWDARYRDGWFRSGDIGRFDDGYLYLADRVDDMIISGGFNVHPTEVERALTEHPAVRDSAVIGEPHPRWGEQVVAVVSLRQPASEEELLEHCRARLTYYKVPKRVVVLDDLPKSGHVKVSRKLVREAVLGRAEAIHGAE